MRDVRSPLVARPPSSGPRRTTALSAVEDVTPPAMTALVRVMEEAGLVDRRVDTSDKRLTRVCLAKADAAYVRTRRQAGVHASERLPGELAGDGVEALVAALSALNQLAELESRDHEGPKRSAGSRERRRRWRVLEANRCGRRESQRDRRVD